MNAKPRFFMVERVESQNFDLVKQTRPRRRSRHDIVAEILETARGGVITTHIMYKARLSFSQLNNYLCFLVEKEFLECSAIAGNRKTTLVWKTTQKGIRFLENFKLLEV